jgi:hypothetical protein
VRAWARWRGSSIGEIPNSKHQRGEIPNSKHQIPNKSEFQEPKSKTKNWIAGFSFGLWILVFEFVWNLVLGIWDF